MRSAEWPSCLHVHRQDQPPLASQRTGSDVRWHALQPEGSVELRLVGQGRGLPDLIDWAGGELGIDLRFQPFVPPWETPGLLRGIDRVFVLAVDDPIPNWSILAAEAEACGCLVVRDVQDLL
jgi:hypothetical protein